MEPLYFRYDNSNIARSKSLLQANSIFDLSEADRKLENWKKIWLFFLKNPDDENAQALNNF